MTKKTRDISEVKIENLLSEESGIEFDDKALLDDVKMTMEVLSSGPMAIDPKYKKPGFVYEFITTEGNEIHKKKLLGYEIVTDPMKVGQEKASTAHEYTSAVTVPSRCGQTLVLMAVSEKRFKLIEQAKKKLNDQRLESLGYVNGIPPGLQFSDVTIKNISK